MKHLGLGQNRLTRRTRRPDLLGAVPPGLLPRFALADPTLGETLHDILQAKDLVMKGARRSTPR